MKKLILAVSTLIVAIIVAIVVFAKLGFIDLSAHVLTMLEKAPATKSYVEVYRVGLEYQEGGLSLEQTFAEQQTALKEIEAELATKEADLLQKEQELATRAAELERQSNAIVERQKALELREENLANRGRMAAVYAGMEPQAAANILLSLATAESADILKRMSDRDIAKILSAMPPEKAAELGRIIAGQ